MHPERVSFQERGEPSREEPPDIEELAKKYLDEARDVLAQIEQNARGVSEQASATPEEKKKAEKLGEKAGTLLRKLYRAFKGVARAGVLFGTITTAGDLPTAPFDLAPEEAMSFPQTPMSVEHREARDLPLAGRFADWMVEGNLVRVYNRMVQYKARRINGRMTSEEVAFKERIAQNMHPFAYFDELGKYEDIRRNEKRYMKKNFDVEQTRDAYGDMDDPNVRIRVDLFRRYLGLPTYGGYLHPSKEKPSRAKNPQAEYVSFNARDMVHAMREARNRMMRSAHAGFQSSVPRETQSSFERFVPIDTFADARLYVAKYKRFPQNRYTAQLGTYGASVGYDSERGEEYIAYYDLWDLDPPFLREMNIDINQFNFPFEIYGRIYESDFKKLPKQQRKKL